MTITLWRSPKWGVPLNWTITIIMSQHKLLTSSNSVLNSGLTDDYRLAIAEYIWNGFDAGASTVDIRYEQSDELGNFASLSIADNGKGIRRDTLEHTFGRFLDSQKQRSFQRTSDVRGKKGKGRFSFQQFAFEAEWTTRYYTPEGKLMQYSITIKVEDLATYSVSNEFELDSSLYSSGTEVKFSNIHDLSVAHITSDSFCDFIVQQYSWFLCLNEAKNFSVQLNGVSFDYKILIDVEETTNINIFDNIFEVTFIRWTRKISDKYYYYMMNSNLHENFKELTSFNNNNIDFYHSIYVRSSYFDKFYYEKKPSTRYDGFVNQSDATYKKLLKELKLFLSKKEKSFVCDVAATKLIQSYEANGILPFFKASEYDQFRKQDLTNTIKGIYAIQPKIFKGLKKEQQKTLVAFLNLLLDSEEREKILFILDGIVTLNEEERNQLANVLHSTTIGRINKVANMMHNRLEAVECLKRLVYDNTRFTTERDHIQKIIEKCFWLFGEQYHLVSADVTFEKALAEYLYILDGYRESEKIEITNPDHNRRPDIFLCRKRQVGDAKSSSMLEENIIVELKRPSVNIGIEQHRQVEDYLRLIKKEARFNSESRLWKFYVVSKDVEQDVKDKHESFKHLGKRYLSYQEKNFEIYSMSWDDIFQEFSYRHEYILGNLNFDKEAINQEIEQVSNDVDGSNTLTQKILALEDI